MINLGPPTIAAHYIAHQTRERLAPLKHHVEGNIFSLTANPSTHQVALLHLKCMVPTFMPQSIEQEYYCTVVLITFSVWISVCNGSFN